MLQIIHADPHNLYREGLKMLLKTVRSYRIVAGCSTREDLLSAFKALKKGLVIIDTGLLDGDTFSLVKELRKLNPAVLVLVLSGSAKDRDVSAMMQAGANGYLLKSDSDTEILNGIRVVVSGQGHFSQGLTHRLVRQALAASHGEIITGDGESIGRRELEVLHLIARECGNREIAAELHLSIRTVEGYRRRLLEKTGAANAIGLVMWGLRRGLVSL